MNSTPASFKRFQSAVMSSVVRPIMCRAGSLLRPHISLCVPSASAGAIRWPSTTNPGGVEGYCEPQDIPIKRKQVVHVLAPGRCTTQSRDHRLDPFAFDYPSTTCITQNALV